MICDLSDHETLLQMSFVSKALHNVAAEYLWARFNCKGTTSLIPFLRSIIHKPELSRLVKHVKLELSADLTLDINPTRCPPIQVPESAVPWLVNSTPAINSLWDGLIRAGDPGAFIALVIALLPNLITIQINSWSMDELDLTCHNFHLACSPEHQAAQFAARSQNDSPRALSPPALSPWSPWAVGPDPFSPYQHLRRVYIISTDRIPFAPFTGRPTHKNDFLGLFYLPSLEHITVPMDTRSFELNWGHPSPPKAAHIKSLNLTMVPEGPLCGILDTTPSLEKLTWDWGPKYYDNLDNGLTHWIRLSQLHEGFLKVNHTLKHLKITGSLQQWAPLNGESESVPYIGDDGTYGIFKSLSNLKTLHVPIVFLLGFLSNDNRLLSLGSFLPSELEHLTISDDLIDLMNPERRGWCFDDIMRAIEVYLSQDASFTPKMRSMTLVVALSGKSRPPNAIPGLANPAGINFKVEFKRFPDRTIIID